MAQKKKDEKKKMGIIGLGLFSRFFIPHLNPYYDIYVYDKEDYSAVAKKINAKWATLEQVCSCEMVGLAVPVQYLEELLITCKSYLKDASFVFDFSSVKMKPVNLMQKYLPRHVEILGTHPLFGPQSGKNGIEGLNIVVCPVRLKKYKSFVHFFSEKLMLNVLERTPEAHDRQMAYVQALTHFIGRAVNAMDIPDVEQKTQAYQYLLEIKKNLGQDSYDLFLTIENENPYAKEIRESFIEELHLLNQQLSEEDTSPK
ncbi:MAG: prephenate dehydrogenase/arogenate dehydrogenase family protein [Cytophagaceae bacterium]|nr:prephenate dehydrogenase/arogenate dehydrogenase family protein [Cytophagaceae bacterium]MDW8455858.1 prephenate dehydrogenase/arogenate dehydrogenase family protein [Cytophagaceae bacterium]